MTNLKLSYEEVSARLAAAREKAEEQTKIYNEAIQTSKFDIAREADALIQDAVADYTSYAKYRAFEQCAVAPDPMLYAVTVLTFKSIRVVDRKEGEEKIPVREIVDADKYISLLELNKYISGGIGHDKKWPYMIENLNSKLTFRVANLLGIPVKEIADSYAMQAISREIDLGKNPVSNTNLLKTMQLIITAMLGDGYKVTSHDVAFLLEGYSKKSRKALTLTAANHKTLTGTMAEICHRVVCNQMYSLEYKKAKEKTQQPAPIAAPAESDTHAEPAVSAESAA